MARILVADDEADLRALLSEILVGEGHQVTVARDGQVALDHARKSVFDLLITDLRMPRVHGSEVVRQLRAEQPDLGIIVLTAHGRVGLAVEAMKLGCFDFLEKPLPSPEALRVLVRRALGSGSARSATGSDTGAGPVWTDPVMHPIVNALRRVARTDATVLLEGESGTGKEVSARAVHGWSKRAGGPFVAVNAATLSETLLESELFGHERGAFTGAVERRIGKLEAANGGTFFLDEVAELPLPLQARLLRVLQERTYERVGGSQSLTADVRWIAATNQDLREMVAAGTFREDLYHRLAVFPVRLPPLRARRGDVWPLAQHLIAEIGSDLGRSDLTLDPSVRPILEGRPWAGNVRELRNTLERASILSEDGRLVAADLAGMGEPTSAPTAVRAAPSLEDAERQAIQAALDLHDGHRKRAAAHLGIGLRTLYDKLKRYGLS